MRIGTDPRSVANFILDVAGDLNLPASNLVLNKVAYFLHGAFLAKFDRPLIDARIEAWEYGPVIREIYHEFKQFKDTPITSRARRISRETGDKEVCSYEFDEREVHFLREVASSYLKLRPGTLVDLSHVHDGPWYEIWFHDGRVNPGMEISDDLIQKHFREKERH
ncbi:Panacea domain-containing protein [Sphingomonas sp. GB1N7]|uniref:Panacea domain-containing protein n=1 Tax=Parasphingomonas caseinilytica TaxID=3096158 RepID=UPI002FCB65AB